MSYVFIILDTILKFWKKVYFINLFICMILRPVWISLIRIRIGIKTVPISMQILPQVLLMLENQNFFLLVSTLPLYNVLSFSSVSNMSYVFNILDSMLKFWKKVNFVNLFICLELICIGRFRIRQNDADPTRSGSRFTTLITAVQCAVPTKVLQLVRVPICCCSLGAPGFIRTYGITFDVQNSKFLVPSYLFIFSGFLYFSLPLRLFH
jgi:hypothetical protein